MKIKNMLCPARILLGVLVLVLLCDDAESQFFTLPPAFKPPLPTLPSFPIKFPSITLPKFPKLPTKWPSLPSLPFNVTQKLSDPKQVTKLFNNPDSPFNAIKDLGLPPFDLPELSFFGIDISALSSLGKNQMFSLFNPIHRAMSNVLIDIFMRLPDIRMLLLFSSAIRNKINAQMFNYCLSVAALHREDTKDIVIPSVVSTLPYKFIDTGTLKQVQEKALSKSYNLKTDECVRMPVGQTSTPQENAMAYFREDIGVNLHHHYWHLIYPSEQAGSIPHKDRRGELFVQMHSQLVRRYETERMCNGLKRIVPIEIKRQKIPEAYKAGIQISPNAPYSSREKDSQLDDFKFEDPTNKVSTTFTIEQLQEAEKNIKESIKTGTAKYHNGTVLSKSNLSEEQYATILGDILESSSLTPNRDLYGDLHNTGHLALGTIHDKKLEKAPFYGGVIMDLTTAMRDPAFYRWHKKIDGLFDDYLKTLAPYPDSKLVFKGVEIKSVSVETKGAPKNEFQTFMEKSYIDVTYAGESGTANPVRICFEHLQHKPYTYKIEVNSDRKIDGIVRIFLAPTYDSDNGNVFDFETQRRLWILMDKFVVPLNKGSNTITRRSEESSITVPSDQTFQRSAFDQKEKVQRPNKLVYTGCGWPEYLLVPKGTPAGMDFKLFVVVTDWADDKVPGAEPGKYESDVYCGVKNAKYPYKRMGFPFDRMAENGVWSLEDYTRYKKNMYVANTKIKFAK